MKETDIQKIVCDVVNAVGGLAFKLNDRFVGGRADLLVKLYAGKILRAGCPPSGFIEVKQRAYPTTDARFALNVTHLQHNFLRNADAAGIPCGVASFLQESSGSGLTLHLHLMTFRVASYKDATTKPYTSHRDAHVRLGRKGDREHSLLSALYNWHEEWRAER